MKLFIAAATVEGRNSAVDAERTANYTMGGICGRERRQARHDSGILITNETWLVRLK